MWRGKQADLWLLVFWAGGENGAGGGIHIALPPLSVSGAPSSEPCWLSVVFQSTSWFSSSLVWASCFNVIPPAFHLPKISHSFQSTKASFSYFKASLWFFKTTFLIHSRVWDRRGDDSLCQHQCILASPIKLLAPFFQLRMSLIRHVFSYVCQIIFVCFKNKMNKVLGLFFRLE